MEENAQQCSTVIARSSRTKNCGKLFKFNYIDD